MKIAFNPLPAPGHLNPTTVLARKLASRGHEVAIVGLADVRPLVEAAGLPFIPCCEDVYPAGTIAGIKEAKIGHNGGLDGSSLNCAAILKASVDASINDFAGDGLDARYEDSCRDICGL